MCRVLEVSKSGYYAWKKRPKSGRAIDNEELLIEIRRVFLENGENYGSPRIRKALDKVNIACSENRVARIMRKNQLVAVHKRKYKATTDSKHNWPVAPNIVNRNFVTDGPNRIWLLGMTDILTWGGGVDLAFLLGLCFIGAI